MLDRHWNIVLTNRAAEPFFAGADPALLLASINLARLALHPRCLARRLLNLTDVRAMLRARMMRQLAAAPDAELTRLYEELLVPTTDESLSLADEADLVLPMIFRIADEQELRLFSTTTTFG